MLGLICFPLQLNTDWSDNMSNQNTIVTVSASNTGLQDGDLQEIAGRQHLANGGVAEYQNKTYVQNGIDYVQTQLHVTNSQDSTVIAVSKAVRQADNRTGLVVARASSTSSVG
jgi:hypothetical protein